MISKELLSEVLGDDVSAVYPDLAMEDNCINYTLFANLTRGTRSYDINIHELSHKCKEWAWKNNFSVSSFPTKAHWRALVGSKELFIEDTEPEAIFKACQWILDNKEEE